MIAIIDYGMGNLRSVAKALEKMGLKTIITDSPQDVKKAKGLILPGVGAFGKAVENIKNLKLDKAILGFIDSGRPFLGICLGLQLLFEDSDEDGHSVKGLGLFKGKVRKFKHDLKIPHMGWNQVEKTKDTTLLNEVETGDYFYFVHSYYVVPEDKTLIATNTSYGYTFASSIAKENVFACQFHPEKSQRKGLSIISQFGKLL
ncbi:MAG: imidazole glycerol phosphate synthase subunit HisH [Spirochaetes bacterium]|nr:imidazole glycerol phosphate synthase subunit HisH [Spirochaetota bacterium]